MVLNHRWHRFYPGIATPDLQLIDSGSPPAGAINAPESHSPDSGESAHARSEVSASGKHPRAPRVTGSFDHAILPMPPASTHFRACGTAL